MDDEEKWVLLFDGSVGRQHASAKEMLAYFRDWNSWLNLFAAAHTGEPATMALHGGPGGTEYCKVIHIDQYNPRSSFDNPLGLNPYGRV